MVNLRSIFFYFALWHAVLNPVTHIDNSKRGVGSVLRYGMLNRGCFTADIFFINQPEFVLLGRRV